MVNIKLKKKSQAFSTDILVVVIIVLFGALFLVMTQINQEKTSSIKDIQKQASVESKIIFDNLKDKKIVDNENVVDVEKLLTLNDEELKAEFGIKNDFAIVFEKDGKLIKIDPKNNINCIGSDKIIVNGESCI